MCTVVYNASPGFPALEVLEFLRARGLSPTTLDDPNPDPALVYASRQTYIVRIAVPKSEARRALGMLQARESGREVLIERATAQLRWQAALGLAISIVVAGFLLVIPGVRWRYSPDDLVFVGIGVAVGAVLATVIVAQLSERLTRRDAPDAPQCRACGYVLLGLTEPRCPECGYPFDPHRLESSGAATPDEEEEPEDSSSG